MFSNQTIESTGIFSFVVLEMHQIAEDALDSGGEWIIIE